MTIAEWPRDIQASMDEFSRHVGVTVSTKDEETERRERLIPGLDEIKRMEYLMSKAPCQARLDELAAYAAKDEDEKV